MLTPEEAAVKKWDDAAQRFAAVAARPAPRPSGSGTGLGLAASTTPASKPQGDGNGGPDGEVGSCASCGQEHRHPNVLPPPVVASALRVGPQARVTDLLLECARAGNLAI